MAIRLGPVLTYFDIAEQAIKIHGLHFLRIPVGNDGLDSIVQYADGQWAVRSFYKNVILPEMLKDQ